MEIGARGRLAANASDTVRLSEEPGVDRVEHELRADGEMDDGGLLGADVAAEVADRFPSPLSQLLAERGSAVDGHLA
jgi:hypothetical protein